MGKKNKTKKLNFKEVAPMEEKKVTPKDIVENLKREVEKLEKNEFSFMFFVMDTKGIPNGSLTYIYQTAYTLKDMGYSVKMLHAEKEFNGVGEWMGEKYAKLPHYDIENDGVRISPSDFLIIPELYSSVMFQTRKLPCKRIVLYQSRAYLTELISPGITWNDYGINECIVDSEKNEEYIKSVFPNIKTYKIPPYIDESFKDDSKAKKLYINVLTKNPSDTNAIVKDFFWRYPIYKWIGFRDIRGVSREILAEALKEAFATLWIDERTEFGHTALEAMAANNILIGKVPENAPDWMLDEDGSYNNNAIWFEKNDEVSYLLSGIIDAFMKDNIPDSLYKKMAETVEAYNEEAFHKNVKEIYVNTLVEKRKEEINMALKIAENKLKEEENKEA